MEPDSFNWMIAQQGTLPLRPDGQIVSALEHRPTSTLIWPANERPSRTNTVLTDPYFTPTSYRSAETMLGEAGISFDAIGYAFVTHAHFDHLPRFPTGIRHPCLAKFEPGLGEGFAGIKCIPCPGHADDLRALVFTSTANEQVWVVGDAVLDEEWLRAWRCYEPNGYSYAEILATWCSVAVIVGGADVIVPGHGAAIHVTAQLVEDLIAAYPQAAYAGDFGEVGEALRRRLQRTQ